MKIAANRCVFRVFRSRWEENDDDIPALHPPPGHHRCVIFLWDCHGILGDLWHIEFLRPWPDKEGGEYPGVGPHRGRRLGRLQLRSEPGHRKVTPSVSLSQQVPPLRGSVFLPLNRGLTPAANTNAAAARLLGSQFVPLFDGNLSYHPPSACRTCKQIHHNLPRLAGAVALLLTAAIHLSQSGTCGKPLQPYSNDRTKCCVMHHGGG
jgi:hypothetical protein